MKYQIFPMCEEDVNIIAEWKYDGIYSFYDTKADKADYENLINPENWRTKYVSVRNEKNELIGYFEIEKIKEIYEIGLAMSPNEVGKGNGIDFVNTGVEYIKQKYGESIIQLSVATFNKRAMKVYKRVGFRTINTFTLKCNNNDVEFLGMELNSRIISTCPTRRYNRRGNRRERTAGFAVPSRRRR